MTANPRGPEVEAAPGLDAHTRPARCCVCCADHHARAPEQIDQPQGAEVSRPVSEPPSSPLFEACACSCCQGLSGDQQSPLTCTDAEAAHQLRSLAAAHHLGGFINGLDLIGGQVGDRLPDEALEAGLAAGRLLEALGLADASHALAAATWREADR